MDVYADGERITATPVEMSPLSTVEAAITASNAALLNAVLRGGAVVGPAVVGGAVEVVVVKVVVVEVVVVELVVGGEVVGSVVAGSVVTTAAEVGTGVDLAAVSPTEFSATTRATMATPTAPITQIRRAMPPFSPV